jgi:hypothetical protein
MYNHEGTCYGWKWFFHRKVKLDFRCDKGLFNSWYIFTYLYVMEAFITWIWKAWYKYMSPFHSNAVSTYTLVFLDRGFVALSRCTPNVDQEERPCTKKRMCRFFVLFYVLKEHFFLNNSSLTIILSSLGEFTPSYIFIHVRSGPIYWGGIYLAKKIIRWWYFTCKKAWKYYMWWYFTCKHVSLF